MSQLMAHSLKDEGWPDIPKITKEGFLYNETGTGLNSRGHRCKEIEKVLGDDLQFSKYFLVLGDNACLHMHKPIEETWPYLLSKKINHQYYNLAVMHGGLEGVKHNLFNWLHMYSKPKMIYMSCEWANSFLGADYDNEDTQEASKLADAAGYWIARRRMFSMLLDQIDIPIYLILGPNDECIARTDSINVLELDHSDDENVAQNVSEGFLQAQRALLA
tara:strand:- start:5451 stop:6104 length:654 start_codon:yes stop_codon:yes gene_type:complete